MRIVDKNTLKLLLFIAAPLFVLSGVGLMSSIEWCHPDLTDRRLVLDYWQYYVFSVLSVVCGISCFVVASFIGED